MSKTIYVLKSSSVCVGGTTSFVDGAFLTKDEAILHNVNNHAGYYEIQAVTLKERELNRVQKFVKKLFKL